MMLYSVGTVLLLWSCISLCNIVESSDCPSVTLSHRSTLGPVVNNGSSITLYQEFVTEGGVSDLNISWSRIPSPLDSSSGSYSIKNHVINNTTLNSSLTLWNIQLIPDEGNYTVAASSNCTSNRTHFLLHVYICEPEKVPRPLNRHNTTAIAEPTLPNVVNLIVKFHGATQVDWSLTDWSFRDTECIETTQPPSMFSCNRTVIAICTFTANLWIPNATAANSGLYTVLAISTVGGPSTNASVDLHIVRQPRVDSCSNGPLNIGQNGKTTFECQLSNYSDFTEVVVIRNDRTMFNQSTKELSFECWHHNPDTTQATCTVSISTSRHSGKMQYKLCVGYNSSVAHNTALQCSDDITVNIAKWKLEVGVAVGGVGLLLLLVTLFSGAVFMVHRKRKLVKKLTELQEPNESSSLLNSTSTSNHTGYTSTQGISKSPCCRQSSLPFPPRLKQPTIPDESSEDDAELDTSQYVVCGTGRQAVNTHRTIWETVHPGALERRELVYIARVIQHWRELARHLGLKEEEIVTIERNHVGDCEEQKIQMLLKWFQQQSTPPTRQSLVRTIEEKMRDPVLAQDITNIVGTHPSLKA